MSRWVREANSSISVEIIFLSCVGKLSFLWVTVFIVWPLSGVMLFFFWTFCIWGSLAKPDFRRSLAHSLICFSRRAGTLTISYYYYTMLVIILFTFLSLSRSDCPASSPWSAILKMPPPAIITEPQQRLTSLSWSEMPWPAMASPWPCSGCKPWPLPASLPPFASHAWPAAAQSAVRGSAPRCSLLLRASRGALGSGRLSVFGCRRSWICAGWGPWMTLTSCYR